MSKASEIHGHRRLSAEDTYHAGENAYLFEQVDSNDALQWRTSCLNLLQRTFGEGTPHYQQFVKQYEDSDISSAFKLAYGIAVLQAAREDLAGGYLFDRDLLLSAETFDDFLDQASHLMSEGYKDATAVLTGGVLETGRRKLCSRHDVTYGPKETIEPLNVKLVKASVYNVLVQKKVTAWADLRNKAAHGHYTEYTAKDVEEFMLGVRNFLTDHLT